MNKLSPTTWDELPDPKHKPIIITQNKRRSNKIFLLESDEEYEEHHNKELER
jgi:hypothetical protein